MTSLFTMGNVEGSFQGVRKIRGQEYTRSIKKIRGQLLGIFAPVLWKFRGHICKLLYFISYFSYPSLLIYFIIIKHYILYFVYFASFHSKSPILYRTIFKVLSILHIYYAIFDAQCNECIQYMYLVWELK